MSIGGKGAAGRQTRGRGVAPRRRRLVASACALAALAQAPLPGWSQPGAAKYPARSVRLLVGQAPGGQTDTIARMLAGLLAERWRESVIVENFGGATGTIAARIVARAPADGYTLLVASNASIAAAIAQSGTTGDDPLREWAPVGRIARIGYVLAVRASLAVTTVAEFAALARARPEALTVATVGAGSNSSQAIAQFERAAGVKLLEIPYKGGILGLQAVVAEQVDSTFCDTSLALPFAASGAVRIIAVGGRRRQALAPEAPTFAESGFPGVFVEPWYGLVAPAGTPAATMAELSAALRAVLADAELGRRFAALGYEALADTPDEFAAAIRTEVIQVRALTRRDEK